MSRKKKDQIGIYEFSGYDGKKKKKKKSLSLRDFFLFVLIVMMILCVLYAITFAMKYSLRSKGISLYQQEDYEGAISLLDEALTPAVPGLENFDNDVRLYLAGCYVNLGEYEDACFMYDMMRLWSDHLPGKVQKLKKLSYGLLLFKWQEYEEALPLLLEAYQNGNQSLVLFVGSCYGQIGDLSNMQKYYDIFLEGNSMNSFMYAQYAAIALDHQNLEQAIQYIEAGKNLQDQSNVKELLFDEIVYYELKKEYNTAYEKAKSFVETYPNDLGGKREFNLLYTRKTEGSES